MRGQIVAQVVAVLLLTTAVFFVVASWIADFDQARSSLGLGLVGVGVASVGVALVVVGATSHPAVERIMALLGVARPNPPGVVKPVDRRLVLIGLGIGVAGVAGALLARNTSPGPVAGPPSPGDRAPVQRTAEVPGPAPAVRSQASKAVNGTTTLPLPRPAQVSPDDVLVAQVHGRGRDAFRAPSGWTYIAGVTGGSGDSMECYWRRAGTDEPAAYEFVTDSTTGKGGGIIAWSGVDPENPILEAQVSQRTENPDVDVPAVLAPTPDTPLLLLVGAVGPVSIAPDARLRREWSVDAPAGEYRSSTMCASIVWSRPPAPVELTARTSDGVGFGGWVAMAVSLRPA